MKRLLKWTPETVKSFKHKKLFGTVGIGIFAAVFLVELLSRQQCASLKNALYPSCLDLLHKYHKETTVESYLSWKLTANTDSYSLATTKSLDEIVSQTFTVPRTEIKGLNGISCGEYNFVSNDLPLQAIRFVSYHEAFHSLGEFNETRANIAAGKIEPYGLIQTVAYSAYYEISSTPLSQIPCRIGRLWNIFKIYFLSP